MALPRRRPAIDDRRLHDHRAWSCSSWSSGWRSTSGSFGGGDAAPRSTGLLGIVLPFACGVALGFLLPDSDLVDPSRRTLVALLLGVALSISALPVIAKTLLDLGLFKTDVGLLVMASAMIDDLVGWLALSLLLGPVRGGGRRRRVVRARRSLLGGALRGGPARSSGAGSSTPAFPRVERVAATGARAACSRSSSSSRSSARPRRRPSAFTRSSAASSSGSPSGGSSRINERTRVAIEDFVINVFAPVFFASIGLRVDFVAAFDLRLSSLVLVLATVPKLVGCSAGGARSGACSGARPRPSASG